MNDFSNCIVDEQQHNLLINRLPIKIIDINMVGHQYFYRENTQLDMLEQRSNERTSLYGIIFLALTMVTAGSLVPLTKDISVDSLVLRESWRQINAMPFLLMAAGY